MKLIKKTVSVLALLFVVFAMTGCAALLGKLANKIEEETPAPENPSVTTEDPSSFIARYGKMYTITIKAEREDNGLLTFQWYKGASNNRDAAVAIDGAAAKLSAYVFTTPVAPAKVGEVSYYWCKVTNTNAKTGKKAEAWSSSFKVTVTNIWTVDSEIDEPTLWSSDYTYYIPDNATLWVNKSLSIPAGTVIKFGKNAKMETYETGTINAIGTKAAPIVFTSYRDNSQGITISDYASETVQKGDWSGVKVNGTTGSNFTYCKFTYADKTALVLNKTTTVAACTFTNNQSDTDYSGALYIGGDAYKSLVTSCIFYNNDWPIEVPSAFEVDSTNIFHNPDAETVKNKNQAIVVCSTEIPTGNFSWNIEELPYFCKDVNSTLWVNGTLNIGKNGENVIVKMALGSSIREYEAGKINIGTNAILTSYRDKDNGGDIFAGGDTSAPDEDGDWNGVIKNDKKVLDNPNIKYFNKD